MSLSVRKAIVRAASYGMNIPEIAVYFCTHKDKITHHEYLEFCDWAKKKDDFYYWLRHRLYVKQD